MSDEETPWQLSRLKKKIRQWTEKPVFRKMYWTDAVAHLGNQVRPEVTAREFLPHLDRIGLWEGMNGALAVLNDDPTGWERLARSANAWYWYFRILIHRFDSDPRPDKRGVAYCVQVAHCVAHLLANGWTEPARWLGDRLARGFSDRTTNAWPETPFEPFMACLYQKWQGIPVGEGLPADADLGVYQDVLRSLEADDASFEASVARACDYHAMRIEDPHDAGFPEFFHPVYNVFPAEILAILRVRASLGHGAAVPKHLILDQPLGHPPAAMPPGDDELLASSVSKARLLWPDFGVRH